MVDGTVEALTGFARDICTEQVIADSDATESITYCETGFDCTVTEDVPVHAHWWARIPTFGIAVWSWKGTVLLVR